ncbi:hypothetical protein BKK79_20695 [Cupriavidus sp. USMAA2-4]|uniref:PPM-type phosphatase domain-containing protein n=2 Tax=Burkholderiaceae TaxID=119060 RepID=A0ABN4TXX6_9BURK|nr:PP2C family serine/threonine-protein phosphatase [Cupriavidus sp. USMAA2-4]AOY94383.1 hypothetical protein BKK79_20695 [Cupriavidus sp. USMAA2-4]AOZ02702.1 hypothetical protein BKK81_26270 [Cupriavidus sp. USMAHM13]AOZ09925.1 hypothetical protein BKK80_30045 [Cupriavidus malaysiensis]
MGWRVFSASATGKTHLDQGLPCQDASAHAVVGEILVAAVCDGAGSARYSQAGAEFFARSTVHALATRLRQGEELPELEPALFEQAIAAVIGRVREALQEIAIAAGAGLDDYATTVVGVVADPRGGGFFHIGDGVGVACSRLAAAGPDISLPLNGEYANETFFVTGPDWRRRLRTTAIRQDPSSVLLMSDGSMPFAMCKGNSGLYGPFIEPVERFLRQAPSGHAGCQALAATLADPRTHAITGDDKTLLIAHRE